MRRWCVNTNFSSYLCRILHIWYIYVISIYISIFLAFYPCLSITASLSLPLPLFSILSLPLSPVSALPVSLSSPFLPIPHPIYVFFLSLSSASPLSLPISSLSVSPSSAYLSPLSSLSLSLSLYIYIYIYIYSCPLVTLSKIVTENVTIAVLCLLIPFTQEKLGCFLALCTSCFPCFKDE